MEDKDVIALIVCALLCISFSYLFCKRVKVEVEKVDIQQEMLNRKNYLQEQQPELPSDFLCQSDPQYTFMQGLVNQIDMYMGQIDIALVINVLPLAYIVHTLISRSSMIDYQNDQNDQNYQYYQSYQQSSGELDTTDERATLDYIGTASVIDSPLMPPTPDIMGMAETNAQVYLHQHFQTTGPMTSHLQRMLINKCTSHKAVDHWNLIQNLDKHFIKKNIELNEQHHILMACLNITKITNPQIGLLSNQHFKLSATAQNIASHLAKHCVIQDSKFNPLLNLFEGISNIVGGGLSNSNQFLDRLERNQRANQRTRTMGRHF